MEPELTGSIASNYPRGELTNGTDLHLFWRLVASYERCTVLSYLIVAMNIGWITWIALTPFDISPPIMSGLLVMSLAGVLTCDSITSPLEVSRGERVPKSRLIRILLSLLNPLCLSLLVIAYQKKQIKKEIQSYDRDLIFKLRQYRQMALAIELMPLPEEEETPTVRS